MPTPQKVPTLMNAHRPDMPQRLSTARILLWLQVALNGCLGVVLLPTYFPTDAVALSSFEKARLNIAGIITFSLVVLIAVCAALLGRGWPLFYGITLGLEALMLVGVLAAFNWFQLPALIMVVAVGAILLHPESLRWFFPPRTGV